MSADPDDGIEVCPKSKEGCGHCQCWQDGHDPCCWCKDNSEPCDCESVAAEPVLEVNGDAVLGIVSSIVEPAQADAAFGVEYPRFAIEGAAREIETQGQPTIEAERVRFLNLVYTLASHPCASYEDAEAICQIAQEAVRVAEDVRCAHNRRTSTAYRLQQQREHEVKS